MKKLLCCAIAILALAVLLIAGSSFAQQVTSPALNQGPSSTTPFGTEITQCMVIPATGTYYLSSDVSNPGTCFSLTAESIILNLNGHTITYNTGNQTQATSGVLGIQCWEDDAQTPAQIAAGNGAPPGVAMTGPVNGVCGDYENPTIYGGSIVEGGGSTAYNNTCGAANTCTITVPSHPIRLGGNGSTTVGPTIKSVTETWSCPGCFAVMVDYGNASVVGGALLQNNTWNNNKTGPPCDEVSCRDLEQGSALNVLNATQTTTPAQITGNTVIGGVQGGIACDAPNCVMANNTIIPGVAGSQAGTGNMYTNNYAILAWAGGQSVTGNTIGSNPPNSYMQTRGIDTDFVEWTQGVSGGTLTATGNTLISNNTVNTIVYPDDPEYGPPPTAPGCVLDGSLSIHFSHGIQNAAAVNNTVNAFSTACSATALRLSDPIDSGNSSSGGTYTGILCSVATCGVNYTSPPSAEYPVTGFFCDDSAAAPSFLSLNDKFIGDGSSIAVDSSGCGPVYFQSPTLGSGTNATGYVTFSFWNNSGSPASEYAASQLYFIDTTFTGSASRTSTNMQVGNGSPYDPADYFIQWTYSGTVKGASGAAIVGATVTVTAASGAGGGTECKTTSTTGGAFFCGLTYTSTAPYTVTSANELTEMDMANSTTATDINTSHNPHSVVVSASGCTTNTSSLTITSTTTGAIITLAGC